MQAGVVDAAVLDALQHAHAVARELGAMHPSSGAAERMAEGGGGAFHHGDLDVRLLFLGREQAAVLRDSPMRGEGLGIERRATVLLQQVERHVEADAAHADDRHLAPCLPRAAQDLDVARDFRVLDAGNRRPARVDAAGDDHLVEAVQVGIARCVIQAYLGAGAAQALRVVGDRFGEFLLAGNLLRQVELAAELGGALEQRHRVAALIRFLLFTFSNFSRVSLPALGLTTQLAGWPMK